MIIKVIRHNFFPTRLINSLLTNYVVKERLGIKKIREIRLNQYPQKKQSKYFSAYTLISALWFIALISFSVVTFNQWQQSYLAESQKLYIQSMALQIAQNQQALRLKSQACQEQVTLNNILFKIQCSASSIIVKSGEIEFRIQ